MNWSSKATVGIDEGFHHHALGEGGLANNKIKNNASEIRLIRLPILLRPSSASQFFCNLIFQDLARVLIHGPQPLIGLLLRHFPPFPILGILRGRFLLRILILIGVVRLDLSLRRLGLLGRIVLGRILTLLPLLILRIRGVLGRLVLILALRRIVLLLRGRVLGLLRVLTLSLVLLVLFLLVLLLRLLLFLVLPLVLVLRILLRVFLLLILLL
ncbi:MAG: hypothetical protein U1F57_11935 [bacterium]